MICHCIYVYACVVRISFHVSYLKIPTEVLQESIRRVEMAEKIAERNERLKANTKGAIFLNCSQMTVG